MIMLSLTPRDLSCVVLVLFINSCYPVMWPREEEEDQREKRLALGGNAESIVDKRTCVVRSHGVALKGEGAWEEGGIGTPVVVNKRAREDEFSQPGRGNES